MRVRPCFFVNVRKARGRRVVGGRRTGRTVAGRIAVEAVVVLVGRFGGVVAVGVVFAAPDCPVRRGLSGCRRSAEAG